MERMLEVTEGYRGKIRTKGLYIAPGVYSNKDKLMLGVAEFMVKSGRARWLDEPEGEAIPLPEVVLEVAYVDPFAEEPVVDKITWNFDDAEGDNAPGEGAEDEASNPAVQIAFVFEASIAQLLLDAGYQTVHDLEYRTDEELLTVPGIGAAKLRIIRTVLGES